MSYGLRKVGALPYYRITLQQHTNEDRIQLDVQLHNGYFVTTM